MVTVCIVRDHLCYNLTELLGLVVLVAYVMGLGFEDLFKNESHSPSNLATRIFLLQGHPALDWSYEICNMYCLPFLEVSTYISFTVEQKACCHKKEWQ